MKNITLAPNRKLAHWGVRYLLFQMLVLPYFLHLVIDALNLPLDESRLNILYYTINFAAVVGIFWRFLQASLQHAAQNISAVLIPAVVYFFVYRFADTLLNVAIYALFPDFFNVNDANIGQMAQGQLPMWAFATIVLVPPVEELLFRGALFGGLYGKNKILAWVVSVLGFALVHVMGYIGYYTWDVLLICILQYLPAGICFAFAYRQSGNILSPILIHAAANTIAMLSLATM